MLGLHREFGATRRFQSFSVGGFLVSARNLLFLLIAAIVSAQTLLAQPVPAEKYVLGWVPTDSIYHAMPMLKPDEEEYAPDAAAMAQLKQWRHPTEVLVFFGSWCKDTKRELPRFLATLNGANNQFFDARFLGLDRSKNDSAGVAASHHITNVPTFIFLRDGQELGRIVEQPTDLIEKEWAQILRNDPEAIKRDEIFRVVREAVWAVIFRASIIF